ncbi:MAG: hypothetical protein PHV99_01075 [Candidatus Pacebacteria bacterium]|nr:hypothetical protein [Candidatus Paceibacterota bacterium]
MAPHLVGVVTMILAGAMALIALPRQIVKNHRDNRVGIDWWIIVLSFGVYASRALYGFLIGSYFIMVPDILGTIFSSVLLYQLLVKPRIRFIERLGC